jgi:nitrogen-specific signal transduction histidine kinase/ActR/RegA family two-component response regulator
VLNPQGELLYFFASQLDVTRRRQSEESVRQAQKMEAVGQLTAGLAHDFNNLLQVIAGNQEALTKRIEQPDLRRRLNNAQLATDRAAKLTGQLLAFARKTRLDPRPVDLTEAVNGFAELLETTLGRHIDLQLNLRRRLPLCFVDQTHLETALLNIVVNARDAMPDGGTVTVTTGRLTVGDDAAMRELVPGDYVVLEVADDGTGMSPAVLQRAAEPFFTTKGQGKGTGLGLAMVHGFLQQSRGRLEIESEVGRGTRVRIILPVHEGEAEEEEAPRAAPEPRPQPMTEPGAESGRTTILVVEDSEDVLSLARESLSELGYEVLTAINGEEALRVLDRVENRIGLLFTDLIMPGSINGLALAEELRRRAPHVPVLLTTGYNEELVQGTRAPGMDVLGKPYRRSELEDRVRSALSGKGGRRRRPSDFGAAEA